MATLITEPEAFNTPELTSPSDNTSTDSKSSMTIYLLIGAVGLLIIAVVVLFIIRSIKNNKNEELNELNDKNTELMKENEQLQAEVQQLQIEQQNYVQHIDRLADQLEAQQQQKIYSPLTPMTENSYDAPDPNAMPTKPQVIKDKEEIQRFVNSKRPTVQDEIDSKKTEQDEQDKNESLNTEKELKDLTHDDDNNDEEHEDDQNLSDLMNIVQSQP